MIIRRKRKKECGKSEEDDDCCCEVKVGERELCWMPMELPTIKPNKI